MKAKFKQQTKIGQSVYKVELNIRDESSINNSSSFNQHGLFFEKLKIVYQTEHKIALNDRWITLFDRLKSDRKKESYCHYLEDINVRIVTKETYFPNGIFATMYTLEDPEKQVNKIKKAIQTKINKEYGFLRFCNIEQVIESFNLKQTNNLI